MIKNDMVYVFLNKLKVYIEKEDFRGYDPYDIHNSNFSFKKLSQQIQFILSQVNTRSPINCRLILYCGRGWHSKRCRRIFN